VSDADLQAGLTRAGVPPATADAIVAENTTARIRGLQASMGVLAGIALIALFFTRLIPTRQPGDEEGAESGTEAHAGDPPARPGPAAGEDTP
ncbi:MAG TPA: MFS transporter, partial [Pseudonocardiaceae bacterium]|nr:MFS transporter [Pseudonocardiaceae bacterium]